MLAFFEEALPDVTPERQAFTSEVVLTAMAAVAEKVTAQGFNRRTVDAWAQANADMYRAYVESVASSSRRRRV